MNKKIVIGVIVLGIVILAGFGASVVWSVTNISYDIGDPTVTTGIIQTSVIPPEYEGYILVQTEVTLDNPGFYDIHDLTIDVIIIAEDWEFTSSLDGEIITNNTNYIGAVKASSTRTFNVNVNITSPTYIPYLAVEDCTIVVDVEVSLIYQPIIAIPYSQRTTAKEIQHNAPFTP